MFHGRRTTPSVDPINLTEPTDPIDPTDRQTRRTRQTRQTRRCLSFPMLLVRLFRVSDLHEVLKVKTVFTVSD